MHISQCVSGGKVRLRRGAFLGIALLLLFVVAAPPVVWAEAEGAKLGPPASEQQEAAEQPDELRWFFFWGSTNTHPRLKDASKLIDRQINDTLRLIAPGFDDVRTFADQRDELMIWTPFVGIGRVLSPRWDAYFQMGYSEGEIQTEATNASLLLLPFHTDVKLERSNFFAGIGTTFFPWGMAELDKYVSVKERLKHTKPFVGSVLSWNYLSFDAKIKPGFRPFGNIADIRQSEDWHIWSVGVSSGIDIPLSRRSKLSFNASYNFFLDHGADFSGPSFSIMSKRFF